ncbi:MAG: ankyrin repeat domain-containing protein [Chitinophagaceae bacterium]|nr:MAG: ankyrin repeat domain-containing protein [Chitinophagaceae bacterium]
MKTTRLLLLLLALFAQPALAQTGPWAKFDQELKDGALYREASAGNLDEVKSIVAGGGNVHYVSTQTKYTILMAAAGSGKIEVVRYLLGLGADPHAKDWWNQTALDKARSVGARDIEALLQAAMSGRTPAPDGGPRPDTASTVDVRPGPATAGGSRWPAFGSYRVGDSALYWAPGGWRPGVVREIGVLQPVGKVSVDYSHRKYLIDPDAYALGNDWYAWSGVVRPGRQPFWTAWFVGKWGIGEVQAHSTDVKGSTQTDTYYYMGATERLEVFANGRYRWRLMSGKTIAGKWTAVPDAPGIVLRKGYRGFDWTVRNASTVEDRLIRKLDLINLKPSANVMSINGRRPATD